MHLAPVAPVAQVNDKVSRNKSQQPYQRDLRIRHIGVGKVVNVALRLSMPHQYDPPWKDAMILRGCTPAHHHRFVWVPKL